ncbi:hypothetical protein D3C71_1637730 [compost metagenome]
MQQQNVEIRGAQPGQNAVDAAQDMLAGKIECVGALSRLLQLNAAFGLDNQLLAQLRALLQHGSKDKLGLSPRVNVRQVKHIDPDGERGFDGHMPLPDLLRRDRLPVPASAKSHAALNDTPSGNAADI